LFARCSRCNVDTSKKKYHGFTPMSIHPLFLFTLTHVFVSEQMNKWTATLRSQATLRITGTLSQCCGNIAIFRLGNIALQATFGNVTSLILRQRWAILLFRQRCDTLSSGNVVQYCASGNVETPILRQR
jgi:hypothetical protein